jgi:hypothetical protein
MAQDGLYMSAAAPWLADFRAELLSFPAGGRHDDAIGLIGQQLDAMVPAAKEKANAPTMWDRWDREERDSYRASAGRRSEFRGSLS